MKGDEMANFLRKIAVAYLFCASSLHADSGILPGFEPCQSADSNHFSLGNLCQTKLTLQYIYKILTPAQWGEFNAERIFSGTELDRNDGYIHSSTGYQLNYVIDKHFENQKVYIVAFKISGYPGKNLRWEDGFPHIYQQSIELSRVEGSFPFDSSQPEKSCPTIDLAKELAFDTVKHLFEPEFLLNEINRSAQWKNSHFIFLVREGRYDGYRITVDCRKNIKVKFVCVDDCD